MHFQEYVRATKIYVVFIFAISLLTPVLAPYLKGLGFTNVQLSLLFSIMPLAIIVASPIIGRVSDRVGRTNVILGGIVGELIAILLYSFGTSWSAIAVARALDAVAAITVTLAALAKIEDNVRDDMRGKYAGVSLSIEYLGRVIGPFVGGILADQFFVRAPFLTAFVILLGLVVFLPKKIERKHFTRSELDWLGAVRRFLSYRELRGMAILGIVMHATFPALMIFLPLLIVEEMGLSFSFVGIAYLVLGSAHILQFIFGRWADKKAYMVVVAGTLISGIFMALVFGVSAYPLLLLMLFFKGIGNSMWNISAWTLMSKIGESARIEGEVIGAYVSIAKIGAFLSFLVSGFVVQFYGIGSLFLANGVLVILGSLIAYPLMKGEG